MSLVLSIAGTQVMPPTSSPAQAIFLDRLTLNLDQPDECEFHAFVETLPGTYHPEQAVTLSDVTGGVTTKLFQGWIFSRHPDGYGTGPGRIGYRCMGLSYGANLIAITASDGTGTMAFNLPSTDTYYSATEAGLSIGTIISQVLSQLSSQLGAIGVSTDSTTTSQLNALTVVSPDPVYIQGNSLWTQLQQILMQWYGSRHALYITPAGLVRCYDTYNLTARTITLDSDPAILTAMSEDTSQSFTQVILRGRDDVEPAWCTLHDGTLIGEATSGGGWTSTQQSSWNWSDFAYPQNGYDQGAVQSMTSTVVTIKSDYSTANWIANYWNGIQGTIAIINPIVNSSMGGFQEVRHITACSALSAGGTCTITVDRPFSSSGYTRYQIVGFPQGGESMVWRKYMLSNSYVAEHLVQQFNFGVPFSIGMGNVSLVTTPIAAIQYTTAGITQITQVPMQIVPFDGTNPGYVLMNNPVVQFTSTQSQLDAGGSSVVAPSDVIVMVPYSRGALTVTSPSGGGYSGSAYSLFGVQRTLYRDYPTWIDAGNTSNMQTLADNILATTSNAIQEGSVAYLGEYTAALPTGSFPICLNIAKATGTTGYESMNAPVRTVSLSWPQEGATLVATELGFSTRRQMYSGDRLYVHPMYSAGGFGEQLGGTIGGGVNFTGNVINALPAAQEGEGFEMGGNEEPRRQYEKDPAKRHAANVAAKRARDDAAERAKDARYFAAKRAKDAKVGRGVERKKAEEAKEQRRKDALHAKAEKRRERERRHDYGQVADAYGEPTPDQARTADREMRLRGSDNAIVQAHQSAYGGHDPAQDIADAPRPAYDGPSGEELASNDQ